MGRLRNCNREVKVVCIGGYTVVIGNPQAWPNNACTGQVGFVAIFERFSGVGFFLLPSIVHAHPPASIAIRWADSERFSNGEIHAHHE
jgi:hypothetical protein